MSPAPEPCRFAVVGCGRISQAYFSVIHGRSDMELVAVADSELEPAQGAAEAWHARPFQDAAEMISETRPEAVIICTPPDTHRDLTITALESGAHVLCEKPLTLTVDGAGAMFDAATRADRHLMMASKFRHARDVVKGRALLAST